MEFDDGTNQKCFNYTTLLKNSIGLSYVSSILSVFGSLLIIATFVLWKDVRESTSRLLLLFLAIADLGTGLGYFSAVTETYYYYSHGETAYDHTVLCRTQSFFTTFFPVSSFFWTAIMGIYFLVALTFRRPHWGKKVIISLNIVGWGVPFVFLLGMASSGILGPTSSTRGNYTSTAAAWCFVSNTYEKGIINTEQFWQYALFEGLCGKIWEMLSYVLVIGCYSIIMLTYRCCPNRQSSSLFTRGYYYSVNNAIQNADFKLILIPILFIFLRIWGTFRYLFSVTTHQHDSCTFDSSSDAEHETCFDSKHSNTCYYALYNFTYYFQAFCDPAQGFGNAIFFVLFSKTIRARLIRLLYIMAYKLVALCCRRSSKDDENSAETTPLLNRRSKHNYSVTDNSREHSTSSPVQIFYQTSDDDENEIKYASSN